MLSLLCFPMIGVIWWHRSSPHILPTRGYKLVHATMAVRLAFWWCHFNGNLLSIIIRKILDFSFPMYAVMIHGFGRGSRCARMNSASLLSALITSLHFWYYLDSLQGCIDILLSTNAGCKPGNFSCVISEQCHQWKAWVRDVPSVYKDSSGEREQFFCLF